MQNNEKGYRIILGGDTLDRVEKYAERYKQGGKIGENLAQVLKNIDPQNIDKWQFLEALLNSKKPQIFAESHIAGNGSDWTQNELRILGTVSIGMTVSIYDNGAHQNPFVHDTPFTGHLVYTPGALLRNDQGHTPADWDAVTTENEFNKEKYFALYERRLLPVLNYINALSSKRESPAFLSIPGIGCGQFSGIFRGQMGHLFRAALVHILKTYGSKFPGIKAIYYDPYNECVNENQIINDTHFIVRPLTLNNSGKSQLCKPTVLGQDTDGDFENCELYSLVAWDHASWPGNDYYLGDRVTDDGVKAAATNTMEIMTGVQGHYSLNKKMYCPPVPYNNWNDVVKRNNVAIEAKDNLFIA